MRATFFFQYIYCFVLSPINKDNFIIIFIIIIIVIIIRTRSDFEKH